MSEAWQYDNAWEAWEDAEVASDMFHIESYPAPHNPNKTVFKFEGACKHGDTVLVVFEFFEFVVEDILKQDGDFDELAQQAVNEHCRQEHQRVDV